MAGAGEDVGRRRAPASVEVARLLAGLRERGLRLTAPRQFVIEVLAAADTHLSVEQIHGEVTRLSPTVNLSTVHRTVATLLEEQIVHAVPTRRGLAYGLVRDHRHHTLCRVCGRTAVLAAPDPCLTGLPDGFHAESIIVYGCCRVCTEAAQA